MNFHVIIQTRFIREGFTACRASKQILASAVDAFHVIVQLFLSPELAVAMGTLEPMARDFNAASYRVTIEVSLSEESLLAFFAFEQFSVGMQLHVFRKSVAVNEFSITLRASEWQVTRMCSHVNVESFPPSELFETLIASERIFASMFSHVHIQLVLLHEFLATHGTTEWFLSGMISHMLNQILF